MAGYFANLRNDGSYISEDTERSVAPGLWRMDSNQYINCNQCFPMNPPFNEINRVLNVDVESALEGAEPVTRKFAALSHRLLVLT